MLKNKKAQSEIITTVLIILLVLAAVVIVWQVVSRTMGTAQTGIDNEEKCRGVLLTVKKAMADGGTCVYVDDGGVCSPASLSKDGSRGSCPEPDTNCKLDTAAVAPAVNGFTADSAKPYSVIVSRDQGNANTFEVLGSVYIQKRRESEWSLLGDTSGIEVLKQQSLPNVVVEVGDSLRVSPKLIDNDFLCGAQSGVKGVAVYAAP